MSYHIYNPEPGTCTCYLGDPAAGALPLRAAMISAGGALLETCEALRLHQFVYTTVKIEDGPSFALTGTVVGIEGGKPLIQWRHDSPREAERLDAAVRALAERTAANAPSTPASCAAAGNPSGDRAARSPGGLGRSGAPPSGAHELVLSGKKLDLGASLMKKAKVVRASDLASRHQTVKVFDVKTIKELIKEAVNDALVLLGSTLGEAERRRLLEEAEAEFKERLRLFEAEKAGLEGKTRVLQAELEKARAVLADERKRQVSADRFTVSDAGLIELEQRLARILDHSVRTGTLGEEIEGELRSVVARLLDDERAKISEQAQQAQSETIALLEKKVGRLAMSLESAEKERERAQRRAHALESSGGIFFGNRMEAGLDEDDPSREKKLSLLKQIFDFNVEVRRELAGAGVVLKGRARPARAEEKAGSTDAPLPETADEEAAVAASLGIKVRQPSRERAQTEGKGNEVREGKGSGTERGKGNDTDVIPMPPEGIGTLEAERPDLPADDEADPDDLPWEPPVDMAGSVSKWTSVRSLGR